MSAALTVQSNRQAIQDHIAAIHDRAAGTNGLLVLASFGEDPTTGRPLHPMVEHFSIGDVKAMTDRAVEWTVQAHRNVYAPLVVMRADLPTGKKGEEHDIVKVLGLVADFDDADAIQWPTRTPIQPTAILQTSPQRFQCIYFFSSPIDPVTAKTLAHRLQLHTGCDFMTKDVCHVWRICGTLNWPNKKKLDAGRASDPCLVVEVPGGTDEVIDPAELEKALPVLPPPVPPAPYRPAKPVEADDQTLLERMFRASNGATIQALWNGDWKGAGYPSQSEADLALASHLAFYCGRDASRVDTLFRHSGLMRQKWNTQHGVQTYGAMTIDRACANCRETYTASRPVLTEEAPADEPDETPPPGPPAEGTPAEAKTEVKTHAPDEHDHNELPDLDCTVGDLNALTTQAWTIVAAQNQPELLYRHGTLAVRLEADEHGRARLVELTDSRLRYEVARLAHCTKSKRSPFGGHPLGREDCKPPLDMIRNMLATPPSEIPLPIVRGIVEVPVVSEDGVLIQTPGYDRDTG